MIDIKLKAIEHFLKWNSEWEFFINLSGQDFPLKSQDEIRAFLQTKTTNNFLTVFDNEFVKKWCNPYKLFRPRSSNKNFLNARSRVDRYFVELPGISHLLYIPFKKRDFLPGVTWYAGWQWMVFNRDFCHYLFTSCNLEMYTSFFKNTFIPDEGFFQTVIMNSTFRETLVNDNKRTVSWIHRGDVIIFGFDKFEFLVNSDNLFARKFDVSIYSEIIFKHEQKIKPK